MPEKNLHTVKNMDNAQLRVKLHDFRNISTIQLSWDAMNCSVNHTTLREASTFSTVSSGNMCKVTVHDQTA